MRKYMHSSNIWRDALRNTLLAYAAVEDKMAASVHGYRRRRPLEDHHPTLPKSDTQDRPIFTPTVR
jgi:hypothetical protein